MMAAEGHILNAAGGRLESPLVLCFNKVTGTVRLYRLDAALGAVLLLRLDAGKGAAVLQLFVDANSGGFLLLHPGVPRGGRNTNGPLPDGFHLDSAAVVQLRLDAVGPLHLAVATGAVLLLRLDAAAGAVVPLHPDATTGAVPRLLHDEATGAVPQLCLTEAADPDPPLRFDAAADVARGLRLAAAADAEALLRLAAGANAARLLRLFVAADAPPVLRLGAAADAAAHPDAATSAVSPLLPDEATGAVPTLYLAAAADPNPPLRLAAAADTAPLFRLAAADDAAPLLRLIAATNGTPLLNLAVGTDAVHALCLSAATGVLPLRPHASTSAVSPLRPDAAIGPEHQLRLADAPTFEIAASADALPLVRIATAADAPPLLCIALAADAALLLRLTGSGDVAPLLRFAAVADAAHPLGLVQTVPVHNQHYSGGTPRRGSNAEMFSIHSGGEPPCRRSVSDVFQGGAPATASQRTNDFAMGAACAAAMSVALLVGAVLKPPTPKATHKATRARRSKTINSVGKRIRKKISMGRRVRKKESIHKLIQCLYQIEKVNSEKAKEDNTIEKVNSEKAKEDNTIEKVNSEKAKEDNTSLIRFKGILSDFVWFAVPSVLLFYPKKVEAEVNPSKLKVSWTWKWLGFFDTNDLEKEITIVLFVIFLSIWILAYLLASLGRGSECTKLVGNLTHLTVISVIALVDYGLCKSTSLTYTPLLALHFIVMAAFTSYIWMKYVHGQELGLMRRIKGWRPSRSQPAGLPSGLQEPLIGPTLV